MACVYQKTNLFELANMTFSMDASLGLALSEFRNRKKSTFLLSQQLD